MAADARLTKVECHLLSQPAHEAMSRGLHPSHTRFDGDLAIALATGAADANLDRLRVAAVDVVAGAIRNAVA